MLISTHTSNTNTLYCTWLYFATLNFIFFHLTCVALCACATFIFHNFRAPINVRSTCMCVCDTRFKRFTVTFFIVRDFFSFIKTLSRKVAPTQIIRDRGYISDGIVHVTYVSCSAGFFGVTSNFWTIYRRQIMPNIWSVGCFLFYFVVLISTTSCDLE